MRHLIAVVCSFAAFVALAGGRAPNAGAQPAMEHAPFALTNPSEGQLSSASCSASACHGRAHGARSEASVWAADLDPTKPGDPHARAYSVLFNPVSRRIADLLEFPQPAHETALCLKCHSVPGVQPEGAVREGVGCGACHGPAQKWLVPHSRPNWKALADREKFAQYDFLPMRNLVARALTCAGCHVGDAEREVNHELVAAGHPRLAFEFAGLHATAGYRKHWVEPLAPAEFEPRAWLVGQAVGLRAATALLLTRARRAEADENADWPEFAGFSCASCHHTLRKDTSRPLPRDQRARGRSGWELLTAATSTVAAEGTPLVFSDVPQPVLKGVHELRALMATANPNPRQVLKTAPAALAELDRWVAALQVAEERARTEAHPKALAPHLWHALAGSALAPDRAALRESDPDFLAAHAAAAAALLRGNSDLRVDPAVRNLVNSLPVPHTPNGKRLDTGARAPGAWRERVRDEFRTLFDRTTP